MTSLPVSGAGLGFKREFIDPFKETPPSQIDFFEIAPENWIGVGGKRGKDFRYFTERYPFIAHGLSLSLGGPTPIDSLLVKEIKKLFHEHNILHYSEHLSFCSDDGHLYDLLPIPFTEESVKHVASRIRQVQDMMEMTISIENASYYAQPYSEMSEIEFINAVVSEADCKMLLDVNNVYVNSKNHSYDAIEFINAMPGDRVSYIHVAGHYKEAEDLLIDTHGAAVLPSVWALLEKTYELYGVVPTMVERDNDIPEMDELLGEVNHIAKLQKKWSKDEQHTAIAS
ncbi:MAG: DUF692 domain-containing protein [Methylococcales bacterium]|jgi:uncharacterized protein (UPF0276 family)|nr:DUF692 domain-containing protein [Methylococcales bacterium]MBT7445176.1 DUF692 domain-containing protein [Methylococcales bacterium]